MAVSLWPGGAAGLVALFVVLVLRGALVPRSTVRDFRADRDARIADRDARIKELMAERDTWRAAYETSEAGRHLSQSQTGELLELSRTAAHVLTSLPRPTREVTAGAAVDPQAVASPP
ncbi:hypothetical protein OG455_41130 [Kitasatospora sp. NBC_01287]|uniref:hypothetical protein n=1 Tax=Kitasatospora sp. NBC_01287 TaxID=2903573 RepID=UPI00224F3511|nr:hypothetical protein [Kitasatospora sp. NBC_01287]MCX4750886.1 hypothetical protein [Kitasatospora sp. NBC_01287]MCX4751845.1 hypothetical protein [Kitasatospora sp. NBC_01287]